MGETKRINWLAILRGLTIALVVMNHVRLLDLSTGGNYQFIDTIRAIFLPLRIPTFIFVSGALLYYTRISKNYTVLALYKDKIVRIGLPLIFCTCLGNIAQIIFNGFVKHPQVVTWRSFFYSFVCYDGTPWPHRWYLGALLMMMALYPLYRILLKNRNVTCVAAVLLLVMVPFDFKGCSDDNWLYFFSLNEYLPFFFLGIATFKYGWWRCLDKWWMLPLTWIAYFVLLFLPERAQPFLSVVAIMSMITTCLQLDRVVPDLFSSFRNYIFQIYLFGIAFQAFVELILWRRMGCPDNFVIPFYILNLVFGIYAPVIISKVVEKVPNKFVRLCFGLK